MALSRLLLLCMVASEVWDAETRPIDFVCERESRRDLNTVADMEAALADCDVLKTLPSPIQLPCIKVHKASWERKSAQEKRRDIAVSLGALTGSLRVVRTLSQPGCASTLLERLEHTVNNYLHIVTHLDITEEKQIAGHTFPMTEAQPRRPSLECLCKGQAIHQQHLS
ncbi:thrombopoietin isoform 2-T3 [Salvelinus alpinus]